MKYGKKIVFIIIIISLFLTLTPSFASDNTTLNANNVNNNDNNFRTLENELINTPDGSAFNLTHNYKYNAQTDANIVRIIGRNITINGNGYTIDGGNQKDILYLKNSEVKINNLILANANSDTGSALTAENSRIITDNLTIIHSVGNRGVMLLSDSYYDGINDKFLNLHSNSEGAIILESSTMISYNSLFGSSNNIYKGFVYGPNSRAQFTKCKFENITSRYCSAIYGGAIVIVRDTTFTNLHANLTAGAIGIKYGSLVVDCCEFYNVGCENDGGAIFADLYNLNNENRLIINGSKFVDCESGFGGAILALDGNVEINNTNFFNNSAYYKGGAVYTSYCDLTVENTAFINNAATTNGYGGAIYFDLGRLTILNSEFKDNTALISQAIYSNDGYITIKKSKFTNNEIYTEFDTGSDMIDNTFENSPVLMDNKNYPYYTVSKSNKINIPSIINSTTIPSKYDLRDYGWVSPVKDQGEMASCWSFGLTGALESAFIKSINVTYDFSENNIKNTVLRYSPYGFKEHAETAYTDSSVGYLLSWIGILPSSYDVYDDLGKISYLLNTEDAIHIQNVLYIQKNESRDVLKKAIMDYGSIELGYYVNNTYYNKNTNSYYNPTPHLISHIVTVVGWDDSYSKNNFLITPPGDGAWIIKNSWGTNFGDKGYLYISYYDKGFFLDDNPAIGIILNDVNKFNKNYQTDLSGSTTFSSYTYYSNSFIAVDDEIISAVGTYFKESGLKYNFSIYVNNELKLTQEGISDYSGYKTINLNKNIVINTGDTFKVVFNNPYTPVQLGSRQHIPLNTSFISKYGNEWIDTGVYNYTVCLKVYTLNLDENIDLDCKNYSAYSNTAGNLTGTLTTSDGDYVSGKNVFLNLTRKTTGASKVYEVITNFKGEFSLPINLNSDFYTFTASYNSSNASKGYVASTSGNIIIVDDKTDKTSTIIASANYNEKYGENSSFNGILFDFDFTPLSGKHVKLNLTRLSSGASKVYDVVCDEEGIFSLDINLAKGEYTVLCTFDGDDIYEASNERNTLTVY